MNCINVTNLTQNTTSTIASKIKAKSNNKNKIKQEISEEILIDTDKFHVILSLTLANNSKENVLNCIKLLEQRDDILSAEPNYFNFIQILMMICHSKINRVFGIYLANME